MKFSIIIPAYNARNTLKACLDAVFSSTNKDFEVIVVDDASTDNSADIAKNYSCQIITLKQNKWPAFAKNTGAKEANGEIFVFLDSDVVIQKNTLDVIEQTFKEHKELTAVTGLLSKECPHKDFFTQYKNLYMHYIFKKCIGYVEFLYGSLTAIKSDLFLKFNENLRMEDTELGQRYKTLNKKIFLNPKLKVTHLKKYNFKKLLKNDFLVPFWWVRAFLMHKGYRDVLKKKRFAHARISQLINILISYLLSITLLLSPQTDQGFAIFLFAIFMMLNSKFFIFLFKEKGALFLLKSIPFTLLDTLVMGAGLVVGFIRSMRLK